MIKMDTLSLFELLKQVVTSWQVIAVTIALLVYLNIVFYVSKAHHRPRAISKISIKRKKPKPEAQEGPEEAPTGSNDNDELGLEESD